VRPTTPDPRTVTLGLMLVLMGMVLFVLRSCFVSLGNELSDVLMSGIRPFASRFRSATTYTSPYLAFLRNLADVRISLISHSYLY
jgi:hypothetical protein